MTPLQFLDCLDRVRRTTALHFEVVDLEVFVAADCQADHTETMSSGNVPVERFVRRRSGGDELHAVQIERLHSILCDQEVADVDRVERAAEQANPCVAFHLACIILAGLVDANTNNMSRWKLFRYQLEAVMVETLAWLMPRLSYGVVRRLGSGLGCLGYYLLAQQRRIARANLDVAFGDTKSPKEKERISRLSFQNFGATLFKLFWGPSFNHEKLGKLVEANVDRLLCIHELQTRGKGVFFLTLHFGDWELLSLATGLYGMPLNVVTETMRNTALERVFARLRTVTGHRIVPQRSAGLKIYKALKRGETVAVLTDLNAPEETGGLWLEFFGLPVFNNASVAALALRSGAAIIGCYAYPLPDGRLQAVYGPEIAYTPTDDYETDIRTISQQCLTFAEDIIREHPEFWLWSYKRWKHRRDAGDTRYPFYTSSAVLPARKSTQVSA